ncbi:MAG: DNA-directed RNA polymerase subunit A' [Nanoarchaeota archaeon]
MEIPSQKKIARIEFGIMSPKFIKDMAAAKVVTPELYDKEGYPVDGGLMDIRLGVIDPGLKCKTCGNKLKECPGHFGYIELARPIIHISFMGVIMDLLRSTCRECSKILIPKNRIDKYKAQLAEVAETGGFTHTRKLIKEIIAALKTQGKCPYCNAKQFKISLEKPSTVIENEKRVSPIEIRTRLEKVMDADLELFGINPKSIRPEWMILTVLAIPPVTMRPSITLESGERSEDDLTHKLGDIVRINHRLFENINAGAPEIIIEDLWDLLQYHITTFFDNEVAQLPPARHRGGQPLKTLTARIKSKEGRIRHNLAGKRTNFSARTVISPDPKLQINEVGVPFVIAMKLTVPERVTEWNKEYLKKFIEKGPHQYPGSNYIIRPDGKRKKITDETKEQLLEELQPGFLVERHLMDGDVTLFNRQPSLHRMSMMCHKVRVLPGLTFRLNPAVCAPYNADFDGDEMNLHVPQTEEARAEAEILMEVQTQLISPRYGLSIIGCNQDAISGNYILTQQSFKVKREEAVDMLAAIGIDEFSKLSNKGEVTGKDIFSSVLPNDFNFKGLSRLYKSQPDHPDAVVEIKNGKLISGIMDKNNLGEGSGLLLRNLHKKYGQEQMVDILGKIYRLGIEVLFRHGFSVAISDIDLKDETKTEIQNILTEAYEEVQSFINSFQDQTLDAMPGRTIDETLELRILERLNRARDDVGRIVSAKADPNADILKMVLAGAKGNLINLAQMSACVGQQALRGHRITTGYKDRSLSCFKKFDLGPAARGFIRNGFKDGLRPHEQFFMAMTGRDSLMDTALRTPKSGYLYRRLANALQDLKVEYDFTVRDASGRIVQFQYGEDSIDVSKSEAGKINVRKIVHSME